MGALDTAVRSGKALYAGISSYSPQRTADAARIARQLGTRLLLHQPSYSMLNPVDRARAARCARRDRLRRFLPLARACPPGSTSAASGGIAGQPSRVPATRPAERAEPGPCARTERDRAGSRSDARAALAWALGDQRVTSVLVGASSTEQLEENLSAVGGPPLCADELGAIDAHAVEADIKIWAKSSES